LKLLRREAWPLAIALAFGLASFASTRGPDGSPLLALVLFPLLGAVYGVTTWKEMRASPARLCIHAIGFLAATCIPFLVPPRLEEMGGILYYALPVLTALDCIVVALAVLVLQPWLARRAAQ